MTPQNMEKENWNELYAKLRWLGAYNVNDEDEVTRLIQKAISDAHSLGEKATLEKVKKALLISLTNEDGSTDVGMFDILWRDVEAYLIIATPTT